VKDSESGLSVCLRSVCFRDLELRKEEHGNAKYKSRGGWSSNELRELKWVHKTEQSTQRLYKYETYSERKYRFAVKKSNKLSYKILLLSDSTFFKLFSHIFAAIIEALIVSGHKVLYTTLIECGCLRC